MKRPSHYLALAVLLPFFSAMDANNTDNRRDFLPIFGRDPPTRHWIWYTAMGIRNAQPPVIYFAEQRFDTAIPEALIVLNRERYKIIATFTMRNVIESQCPSIPYPVPPYSLKISQRSGNRAGSCVLPRSAACSYLFEVIGLSGMNWSAEELGPIKS